MKTKRIVQCSECNLEDVKDLIQRAGTQIGSVHFRKRSDNSLRKMCYRLHVTTPQFANAPKGKSNRKTVNKKNNQLTVFDVNKVLREKDGSVMKRDGKICRGAWRTIPLEGVERICVNGETFIIEK